MSAHRSMNRRRRPKMLAAAKRYAEGGLVGEEEPLSLEEITGGKPEEPKKKPDSSFKAFLKFMRDPLGVKAARGYADGGLVLKKSESLDLGNAHKRPTELEGLPTDQQEREEFERLKRQQQERKEPFIKDPDIRGRRTIKT